MKFQLPQLYFSKLMRAITEFQLIRDNDNIMIGVSGGKDSLFLAYAMAMMQQRLKKHFTLQAVTINPMFSPDFAVEKIASYMKELNIPFSSHAVDIAGISECGCWNRDSEESCAKCERKGFHLFINRMQTVKGR